VTTQVTYLKRGNFGGFGGFSKNPPQISSRKFSKIFPWAAKLTMPNLIFYVNWEKFFFQVKSWAVLFLMSRSHYWKIYLFTNNLFTPQTNSFWPSAKIYSHQITSNLADWLIRHIFDIGHHVNHCYWSCFLHLSYWGYLHANF